MRVLVYAALAAVLPSAAIAAPTMVPAEAELRRQLFESPGDPVLMAQLARSYAENGRAERAKRLYRAMLRDEDVQLRSASGTAVSSHALARAALERLSQPKPVQLTAR